MKRVARIAAGVALAFQSFLVQAQYSAEFIESSKAWGSVVADFNGDGHDDIFITGHDTDDRIWYWTPAGYQPSAQALVWVDRHDCDAADFNRDGRLDLYCAVGADRGQGVGANEVWLQDADGRFNLLLNHGAEDIYGSSRIPMVLDVNHDGYPDIYLTNERRTRADGNLSINRLFVNQGGTGFTELVTAATGERGSACAVKGDIDGDGWDDLIVCDLSGPPHVYLNNRAGDFAELNTVAAAVKWVAAQLADMNGDGRADLVTLAGNKLQIWFNTGAAPYFVQPGYQNQLTYTGKSLTVGDFNQDGRWDVYVVLMKSGCPSVLSDQAPDLVFQGMPSGSWSKIKQPQSAYAGCGHLADTVDGSRVLLMNGGISWRGPNYVLSWVP
ncbi:VCBS repeat-containing protein [Ideonella sp.]|uniref:FG-GAP repeat domain-containing protein n=1 Tax=Ideonella sp. TaxID=1929293 RepID=UPI002B4791AC|nr:VCBS repeat-containing protein [Ideonella sp.]HJV68660.1 VCBS repeat-containing protein [Ideonella sp.]